MSKLSETTFQTQPPEVDAEAGVLRGVKLLGTNSKNNRIYSEAVRREALPLYKGRKVYIDHQAEPGDRRLNDWAGKITEAENRPDGIYGTVKLRKQSPHFAGIIEAAQDFDGDIGFSHVADGQTRMDGDTEIVEAIREVFSVDLVTDPATTAGMFESEGRQMPKTVKEIAKAAPDSKWGKLLKEMADDGAIAGDMPVEVAAEADPAAEVAAALEKAAVAVLKKLFAGEIDEAAAMAEIKKILGMKEEATDAPEESSKPEPPTEESIKLAAMAKKLALMEAKTALLESGREASEVQIHAVASAPETARKALIETWPVKGSTAPSEPSPPAYGGETPKYQSAEHLARAWR